MTTRSSQFTRADYERLPEGFPVQLIQGSLIKEPAPAPWHQVVVGRVEWELKHAAGPDRVLVAPVDLFIDDLNVLQPDILLLPEGAVVGPSDREVPVPLLVVEVLSPSTAARDRDVKTSIYLSAGVTEVWLVDPDARAIEVRTATGSRKAGPTGVSSSAVLSGFRLDPVDLFRV